MTEADQRAFDAFEAQYGPLNSTAKAAWRDALTHARGKQEPVLWPNRCDDSAVKALRFLADHERPSGGESSYNSAHLMQIASEVEAFSMRPLYTTPPAESGELARLRAENERLTEALTPSGGTKAAYWGEFSIDCEQRVESDDDDDDDDWEIIPRLVPWTVIKEIMAAISTRAALAASPAPVVGFPTSEQNQSVACRDPDAIWNEAIEAAAGQIQRRIDVYIRDHSDCDCDPETGLCEIAPNVAEEIEASEEDIRAIRALKRQQGGGE